MLTKREGEVVLSLSSTLTKPMPVFTPLCGQAVLALDLGEACKMAVYAPGASVVVISASSVVVTVAL